MNFLILIVGENMTCEETKRNKARNLRYKKAIVRDLNYESILQKLWEMQEECEEIKWFYDSDEETLINSLIGDDDEAFEFKMMFSSLCYDCERMMEDLHNEYIPEYFDYFFVGIGGGEHFGGFLGYDSYEEDYFGIDFGYYSEAEKEAQNRLMRLTKKELIEASSFCFRVAMNFVGLQNRYDNLKAAIDILKDQNTGYLKVIKQIEELYEKANANDFYSWYPETREFDKLISQIPQETWLQ